MTATGGGGGGKSGGPFLAVPFLGDVGGEAVPFLGDVGGEVELVAFCEIGGGPFFDFAAVFRIDGAGGGWR